MTSDTSDDADPVPHLRHPAAAGAGISGDGSAGSGPRDGGRTTGWWLLVPSALLAVEVVAIAVTRGSAVRASQPAYLVTLVVVVVAGVAGVVWSLPGRRMGGQRRQSALRTWVRRVLGVLGALTVFVVLGLLRPLPATATAVDATASGDGVTVTSSASLLALLPVGHATRTGLIFYPGALVDPRAYVPLLRPLARDGFTVDIVKPPYGIAFLASAAPTGLIADQHSVTHWVVGGHSLGGVVASLYADGRHPGVDGLLLWASYPSRDMDHADRLAVTSVSASLDGLATPADIESTRHRLPPQTRFVVVEGAVHSDFGDYGSQRGDGTATIPKAEAQRQIEAASLALLRQVDGAH